MAHSAQKYMSKGALTLNLLTTTIVAPPSNASKWQMGFNSAFKGLNGIRMIYSDTQMNIFRHDTAAGTSASCVNTHSSHTPG